MYSSDKFKFRKTPGKNARIVVRPDCSVTVYSPEGFDADSFVRDHSEWIRNMQDKYRQIASSCPDDGRIMLWARHYHLVEGERCRIDHDRLEVYYSSPSALKRYLKKILKDEITDMVDYYCSLLGVSYGRISIRSQKTRWGSCSSVGNLNFNLRILSLPGELLQYIVAHEVCHLKIHNHSVNFWDHVGVLYPEYRAARGELKKYWVILENGSVWKALENAGG